MARTLGSGLHTSSIFKLTFDNGFLCKNGSGLIQEFSVQPSSRNVPDHSMLLCTLELSDYIKDNLYLPTIPTEHPVNGIQNTDVPCRKYSVDSVPINIF